MIFCLFMEYAKHVCVFIDIDQLKGKPMQNLVENILGGSRDLNEHFTNCYDYSTHLRVMQ